MRGVGIVALLMVGCTSEHVGLDAALCPAPVPNQTNYTIIVVAETFDAEPEGPVEVERVVYDAFGLQAQRVVDGETVHRCPNRLTWGYAVQGRAWRPGTTQLCRDTVCCAGEAMRVLERCSPGQPGAAPLYRLHSVMPVGVRLSWLTALALGGWTVRQQTSPLTSKAMAILMKRGP